MITVNRAKIGYLARIKDTTREINHRDQIMTTKEITDSNQDHKDTNKGPTRALTTTNRNAANKINIIKRNMINKTENEAQANKITKEIISNKDTTNTIKTT